MNTSIKTNERTKFINKLLASEPILRASLLVDQLIKSDVSWKDPLAWFSFGNTRVALFDMVAIYSISNHRYLPDRITVSFAESDDAYRAVRSSLETIQPRLTFSVVVTHTNLKIVWNGYITDMSSESSPYGSYCINLASMVSDNSFSYVLLPELNR